MKWQRRRLARAQLEGFIVRVSTSKVIGSGQEQYLETEQSEESEFGGIAILYPPRQLLKSWSIERCWTYICLQLQDWFDPVSDEGSNMKVCTASSCREVQHMILNFV